MGSGKRCGRDGWVCMCLWLLAIAGIERFGSSDASRVVVVGLNLNLMAAVLRIACLSWRGSV